MKSNEPYQLHAFEHTPPLTVQRTLENRIGKLSMLPAIAIEAIRLTEKGDCTVSEFSDLIRRDMALATKILSYANKAIYSHGRKVDSLEHAVVRLGFLKCRNLIITCSTACLMKKLQIEDEWVKDVLWRHSFTTATACTVVNRSLSLGFHGEEFVCGLLHDFGRLLMAIVCEQFSAVDSLDFDEGPDTLEHEQTITGTNHCQLGAWFAKNAGLPENLVEAILWHHNPNVALPCRRLVALTNAADHLANFIQRGADFSTYDSEDNAGVIALCEITNVNVTQIFSLFSEKMLEEISLQVENESFA